MYCLVLVVALLVVTLAFTCLVVLVLLALVLALLLLLVQLPSAKTLLHLAPAKDIITVKMQQRLCFGKE